MRIPTDKEKLVLKNASDGESASTQAYCRVTDFDSFLLRVGSAQSAQIIFCKKQKLRSYKLIELVGAKKKTDDNFVCTREKLTCSYK